MTGWKEKLPEANGEWRIKDAEFKGYSKSQFDALHESLYKIDRLIESNIEKCNKNSNDISSLRAQSAMISVVFASVVAGVTALAFRFMGG